MRLVALIFLAPVSSKTDVTTSSYEGFKFCADARVNASINVKARMQVQKQGVRIQSARGQSKKHGVGLTGVQNWSEFFVSIVPRVSATLV